MPLKYNYSYCAENSIERAKWSKIHLERNTSVRRGVRSSGLVLWWLWGQREVDEFEREFLEVYQHT